MAKGKPRPPPPPSRLSNRSWLSSAEVSTTDTLGGVEPKQNPRIQQGETVAIPSHELFDRPAFDFQKWSFYLGLAVAILGALWHYADTTFTVKGLSEDVKGLKQKSEQLVTTTLENSTRLSALEASRSQTTQSINVPSVKQTSKP